MKVINIPIKCTPQLITLPATAKVLAVDAPRCVGFLHLPHLMVSIRDHSSDDTLLNLTVYSVPVDCGVIPQADKITQRQFESYDGYYGSSVTGSAVHRGLLSMMHNCEAPVDVQESYMRFVDTFVHYYNKCKYAVYVEDMFTNNTAGVIATAATGSSRAISEGSLSRTIT